MLKILEIFIFAVSAVAFGYGVSRLFREGVPVFFKLYVCAAGCYMVEELWVVVNTLLGNGSMDGLVTVRLFGFFGCLCFMLSANANEFDRTVDDGSCKKARVLALIAPVVMLALYAINAFSPQNRETASVIVTAFISIAPALFAAWFSLKHLLLPDDAGGLLKLTKGIDILALIFYGINYLYPLADLFCSDAVMCAFDLVLALVLFGIVIQCRKGADRWKTPI